MITDKDAINKIYLESTKIDWLSSSEEFPVFTNTVSKEKKNANEQYLTDLLSEVRLQLQSVPRNPLSRRKWRRTTKAMLCKILSDESVIGLHECMGRDRVDAFMNEQMEFMRNLRRFSPELNMQDAGQAIRNYMVYSMFSELFNGRHIFNHSAFGYSMLYPFTDNFIDNPDTPADYKLAYNEMIRKKITGLPVSCDTTHSKKTCELLDMILKIHPKGSDSGIQGLLLLMLEAQESSLYEQHHPDCDELWISLYKGGISVLIDRCFVDHELTEEDALFYLGFGFMLQLADDLQDIQNDLDNESYTLFTRNTETLKEELLVNKLLNFTAGLMDKYHAPNDNFKDFIFNCSCLLIYTSASGSRTFFSQEYLDKLEAFMPVSFDFLENIKKDLSGNTDFSSMTDPMKIIDELIKK